MSYLVWLSLFVRPGRSSLPGAMVGLLLAGTSPLQAIQVQPVVSYLIVGSVAVSITIVTLGLQRPLFTPPQPPRSTLACTNVRTHANS